MHPLPALAQSVQNGADRVGNAAQQQKQKTREGQRLHRLLRKEDDRPAHADIADHGKDPVFLQVNGRQGRGQRYHAPLKAEQHPGKDRVLRTDGGQQNHGVGSRDEEINGAVVDHLHHLFAKRWLQTVVDAGNGKHGDHGAAVNSGGDDAPRITVESGKNDAQRQRHDAYSAADDVGDHVHDLFAPAVIRELAVGQFRSFHFGFLPL